MSVHLLAVVTLVLLITACETNSNSANSDRGGYVQQDAVEGPTTRTAPVPAAQLNEAAFHGETEEDVDVLVQALLSTDDNQARKAASALLNRFGCAAARGPAREALIRQARIFPTPHGVILLGCLSEDEEAINALHTLEPPGAHLRSPFSDWESLRTFALAEAGDPNARQELLTRLENGELALTTALLNRVVFPYVQDSNLLLALSESILDSRLVRPGEATKGDFPNPEISVVAALAFVYRFGIQPPRDEEGRPRPFTEAEKRAVYEEVQRRLRELEEGERLPQKRLPGRVLP